MEISKSIKYIGVNDYEIDLFEGQYIVPNGMAYNSYVLLDDKIAVFDTVSQGFGDKWLENLQVQLQSRTPDYLIIQHVEPDHSANIKLFMEKYPNAIVVASAKAFTMINNFYRLEFANKIVANEGQSLSLGEHTLVFYTAPMVHWPEVIVTYEKTEKVLFSADGFGKFGAIGTDEDWACEARRYYAGIVSKYGAQVQALLKKLATLEVNTICPLHGPILTENLGYYIDLYNTWSSYGVESEGVVINYTSVYGNTKKAVELLTEKLKEQGCKKVAVNDLARCDMAEAVEDALKYGKIVLATTTYNGSIFPFMKTFVDTLVEHNISNRQIGFIENGTWAPIVGKIMKGMLENCKNLTFVEPIVKILSSVTEENISQIESLAKELCK